MLVATLCTFSYIGIEQWSAEQLFDLFKPKNILVVRTDRIGDVILSLPMISALRSCFPTARISMLLRSYTTLLADGYSGLDAILSYDDRGIEKPLTLMLREIKSEQFDAVIISYPTFRLALLMFLAGIPTRIGTGYRLYSFLFNNRVYEHRKTSERHEAEYNLSLLKMLGCETASVPNVQLNIQPEDIRRAMEIREMLGILPEEEMVVLHPGSGGSARDWSAESFGLLARLLTVDGRKVVISGGPGEEGLVRRVVNYSGGLATPLHIAAVVATPVIGLYPPILACSPVRWGPLTSKSKVLVPNANDCPRCKGSACQGNDCMTLITPEQVFDAVKELIGSRKKERGVKA
jgi:heptosyltransferase-3